MTRDGDGEFENLDWCQGRAQTLHQLIVDRFVVAREPIGILEDELLALGEQRVVAEVVDRGIDVFSD